MRVLGGCWSECVHRVGNGGVGGGGGVGQVCLKRGQLANLPEEDQKKKGGGGAFVDSFCVSDGEP